MRLEKRNAYVCEKCMKITLTVHIDEGVTPMFLTCKHDNCDGLATSFGYRLPPPLMMSMNGKLLPSHEWYKPKSLEGLNKGEQEHVKNGGVLLRKRTDAIALTYEIGK